MATVRIQQSGPTIRVSKPSANAGSLKTARPSPFLRVTTPDGKIVRLSSGGVLRLVPARDILRISRQPRLRITTTFAPAAGVTSIIAGVGISVDQATGDVTITNTGATVAASTSTLTNVPSSTSSVLILAANANRLGATIVNDSNSRLFLKLGAVATTSDFTVRLSSQDIYEVPSGYTGIIDGIWAPNVSGFARVTEFTP